MRRSSRGTLAIGACLTALVSAPAWSQQPTQAQASAIRSACRSDYQAHCANVPTGGQAALQCLQQNASILSSGCQQALAAVQGGSGAAAAPSPSRSPPAASRAPAQPTAGLREACGFDFRRYCRGIPLGGGRALSCLEANRDRLSPNCQNALVALRERATSR